MNTKKGFTIIEVLVGLFIAVMAATYAAKTITSTNKIVSAGRDTFIATNLAHEGIDLTRAMRDNTWFTDQTPENRLEWMEKSGICEPDAEDHSYTIDSNMVRGFADDQTIQVAGTADTVLYDQGDAGKIWSHDSNGSATKYRRVLTAECEHVYNLPPHDTDNPQAFVTIESKVSWNGQFGDVKSVTIKERLYNWMQ